MTFTDVVLKQIKKEFHLEFISKKVCIGCIVYTNKRKASRDFRYYKYGKNNIFTSSK